MDKKTKIMEAAHQIRQILLDEFPERPNLQYQCKRASILFDIFCKGRGITSYPVAGHITKKDDYHHPDRGHVWNIVHLDGNKYILDITLTQFVDYLGIDIPAIIFMPLVEAKKLYSYKHDRRGKYAYEEGDVRKSLVEKVKSIL